MTPKTKHTLTRIGLLLAYLFFAIAGGIGIWQGEFLHPWKWIVGYEVILSCIGLVVVWVDMAPEMPPGYDEPREYQNLKNK